MFTDGASFTLRPLKIMPEYGAVKVQVSSREMCYLLLNLALFHCQCGACVLPVWDIESGKVHRHVEEIRSTV